MKILGTGCANPSCVVTNQMLEGFLDTSDQWITERTGIKERPDGIGAIDRPGRICRK